MKADIAGDTAIRTTARLDFECGKCLDLTAIEAGQRTFPACSNRSDTLYLLRYGFVSDTCSPKGPTGIKEKAAGRPSTWLHLPHYCRRAPIGH
jgi:hypothetical protein